MPNFTGTDGNDTFAGTADNEIINGGAGNDILNGGDGNDTIDGGSGQDQSFGDGGDDTLIVSVAGVPGEIYSGGDGTDTLRFLASAANQTTNASGLAYNGGLTGVTLSSIERFEFGSIADASMTVSILASQIGSGLSATAEIVGGAGRDQLAIIATTAGTYTLSAFTYTNWTYADEAFEQGDVTILVAGGNGNFTLNAAAGHLGLQSLLGGNGNDTLNGTDGMEALNGGGGINTLNAGGGDDVLLAVNQTSGNGIYSNLNFAGNLYNGGAGFDWLSVGGYVNFQGTLDSIEGINFQDAFSIPGGASQDEAHLEINADVYPNAPEDFALHLRGTGTLSLEMNEGDDFDGSLWVHEAGSNVRVEVFGTDLSDTFVGTSGSDRFSGGIGADTMTGGLGADQFEAGEGQHTVTDFSIAQGDRVDLQDMNITSFAQLQPYLAQVGANVVFSRMYGGVAQTMTLLNVNLADLTAASFVFQEDGEGDVRIGTDEADDLIGAQGEDYLEGRGGNDHLFAGDNDDVLDGGAGDDVIDGGNGMDQALYESATSGVTVNLALSGAQNTGGAGVDTLIGIEELSGSAFNDALFGTDGDNELAGNGGNDVLRGGEGDDYITGGEGNDSLFQTLGQPYAYTSTYGNDVYDGGAGIDRVSLFTTEGPGVTVDLNVTTAQNTGAAGIDTFIGIEHVTATFGNDTLTGNADANWFWTFAGSDALTGNGGNDFFTVGQGDKVIDGGADVDSIDIEDDAWVPRYTADGVTISLLLQGQAQETGIGLWTLNNIENLGGNFGSDELTGDNNANTLAGYLGDDRLNGGGGNDILAGDGVWLVTANVLTFYADLPEAGPGGNDTLEGGAGDDTLYGGGGNDILDGGEGNDFMVGGAGDDVYVVGNGDGIAENADEGIDEVQASVDWGLFGYLENLTGTGTGDIFLGGSGLDNVITGNSGNNHIVGLGGDDTIDGGAGNDVAAFRLPANSTGTLRVVEGEGGLLLVQLVQAGGSFETLFEVLPAATGSATVTGVGSMSALGTDTVTNVEDLHFFADTWPEPTPQGLFINIRLSAYAGPVSDGFAHVSGSVADDVIDLEALYPEASATAQLNADGGLGDDTISGTALGNWMDGGAGNDTLSGRGGSDTLIGSAGGDTLDGGAGNDFLHGGVGNDTLDGGEGQDQAQFVLTADLAGTWTLIKNYNDGSFSAMLTRNGVQEEAFRLTHNGGTWTVVGMNSAAYLGTETLTNVETVGFFFEGPFNNATSLFVQLTPIVAQNGTRLGGLLDDVMDYSGLAGPVTVNGNFGDDTITGTNANDVLSGGADNDTMSGLGGDDFLQGQQGNDILTGGAGSDNVRGNAGDDQLSGGDGNDILGGGAGVDSFDGGSTGESYSFNGFGDRVSFYDAAATQAVVADLRTGIIENDGFGNEETMVGIESLGSDTAFADTFHGNDASNTLFANRGDFLYGHGGADDFTLTSAAAIADGGEGADLLTLDTSGGFLTPDANSDGLAEAAAAATSGWTINLSTGALVDGYGNSGVVSGVEYISASALNDSLTGGDAADNLGGNFGNDTLYGGGGNDVLSGDDVYDFVNGMVTLIDTSATAPGGNDHLDGGAGNDVLLGGTGNDVLNGGEGDDTLTGGEGFDTASYENATGAVHVNLSEPVTSGADGVDTLTGIERLIGSAFDDLLAGDAGDNVLEGRDGNDQIYGSVGADQLFGEEGNDQLYGIDGDDRLDGGNGNDSLDGNEGHDELFGQDGDDYLYGGEGNDRLSGGFGANTLYGGLGLDQFEAGEGQSIAFDFTVGEDLVDLTDMNITSFEQAQQFLSQVGSDVVFSRMYGGVAQTLTLKNVTLADLTAASFVFQGDDEDNTRIGTDQADELIGAGGNDILEGRGGNDYLFAGDGNDVLDGGAGDDTINGGNGNDTAVYAAAAGAVTVSLFAGTAAGADGNDVLSGIENVTGSTFGDTIVGSDGANVLDGGAGNDFLSQTLGGSNAYTSTYGNDLYDGGAGIDRVSLFTTTGPGVTVDLNVTTAQNTGAAGTDTFIGIEHITATFGSDTLTGNAAANWFWTFAGNDTLTGNGGNDYFTVGYGNKVIDGGTEVDTVDVVDDAFVPQYTADGITVSLQLQGTAQQTGIGAWTLTNVENLGGWFGSDELTGDGNANILAGGQGDDTLRGGVGDDILAGDGAFDIDSDGVQIFFEDPDWVGGNDTLEGGAGNDTLYGGGGNDVLRGQVGNDLNYGGAGNDLLVVGAGGDDLYDGGAGSDRVSFFADTLGAVTVDLRLTGAQNTGRGNATFAGVEHVTGDYGNDTLTGTDATNWFWSFAGTDTLSGNGGDDYFTVGYGTKIVDGGAGSDVLEISDTAYVPMYTIENGVTISLELQGQAQETGIGSFTLNGIENLAGDVGNDTFIGDANANILAGYSGNDTLRGGGGNDFLSGDGTFELDPVTGELAHRASPDWAVPGNDTLEGGSGDDILVGGGGDDSIDGGVGNDLAGFYIGDLAGTLSVVVVGGEKHVLLTNGETVTHVATIFVADGMLMVRGEGPAAGLGTDAIVRVDTLRFLTDDSDVLVEIDTGVVADGLVAGATVFMDANGNGALDEGEARTTTGADGSFSFVAPGSGPIVAVGGTNTDTGLPNTVTLRAPEGSSVINPITTLIQAVIENSEVELSAEAAAAQVASALGLSAELDLLNLDIFTAAGTGNAAALDAQKAAAIIVSVIVAAEDASTDAGVAASVLDGLAAIVIDAPEEGVTLSSQETITAVLSNALPPEVVEAIAADVASEAQAIDEAESLEDVSEAQASSLTTGNDLANTLTGGTGDDVLQGRGGTDTLTGGGGADTFLDTGAGLNGDTITDFGLDDRIVISDATLAGFTFSVSGNTLTYAGGTLTLQGGVTGRLIVSAASEGGVQISVQTEIPDAAYDFNGDGRSDILWRSTSGQMSDWLANASGNGSFANNDANAFSTVATSWTIAGSGDFNGDGNDDVLWRNTATGQMSNWLANANGNGGFTPNDANAFSTVPTSWVIAGTGDFNGDGKDDIVWRNTATGQMSDWLANASGNGGFTANDANALSTVSTSWVIAGTGDFNGDGKDDLLWRNTATGQMSNWLANGNGNGGFTANDANAFNTVATSWAIAGSGDFNGDGKDDLLWRNTTTGQLSNWLANSSGNGGFTPNDANAFASAPTSWHIAAVGDYNGDGRDDILWRSDSGQLSNWLANGNGNGGFTANDANAFTSAPTDWLVQAPDTLFV